MERRRGRPPYPDVLTPRQWEVLALLREGLSNEAIARRLGISLDGVKFHVSEILGKLGVTSRNEAARWSEERERRATPSASLRWWRRRGREPQRHRGTEGRFVRTARAGTLIVGQAIAPTMRVRGRRERVHAKRQDSSLRSE